jgi:hypothetical protein
MAVTTPELLERAIVALEVLARTAEPIDDEQPYVRDLVTVWSARLRAVGQARSTQPVNATSESAVDWLAAEAGRIADPHRAIDWLSSLPQAILLAVGEDSA